MSRPVILLVFANNRAPDGVWLPALDREHDRIRDALTHAEQAGACRVETVFNATLDLLFERLVRYGPQIVGIHFAGHAEPEGLCLDSELRRPVTASVSALVDALARLPRLRWIFLNGCGTEAHVAAVHLRIAVPVVATSSAILDRVACDFAGQFYCALAHGEPLRVAFESARTRVQSEVSDAPSAMRPAEECRMLRPMAVRDAWPWALHLPRGRARRDRWRLRPSRRAGVRRVLTVCVMLLVSATPSVLGGLVDPADGEGAVADGLLSEALAACECEPAADHVARLGGAQQAALWSAFEDRCGAAPRPGSCAAELATRRDDAASVHRCDEARALQRRLAARFWVEPSPIMRAHCGPGS